MTEMELTIDKKNQNENGISNGILGMVFLLATEAMFFAGLISAFIVNRSKEPQWPPFGQPRLPIEITAVNTIILICSAVMLYFFSRSFKKNLDFSRVKWMLATSILLGFLFLVIQGNEWVRLLGFGLSSHNSIYGGFFYLIIGAHGVHVFAGLSILIYLFFVSNRSTNSEIMINRVSVCGLYWYFVVFIWPLLYYLVYIS